VVQSVQEEYLFVNHVAGDGAATGKDPIRLSLDTTDPAALYRFR
jgi:hypothetical protein